MTDDNQKMINAGQYLIKFKEQFLLGFLVSLLGLIFSIIAMNPKLGPVVIILGLLGVGLSLAGVVIVFLSVYKIGKAGEELIK